MIQLKHTSLVPFGLSQILYLRFSVLYILFQGHPKLLTIFRFHDYSYESQKRFYVVIISRKEFCDTLIEGKDGKEETARMKIGRTMKQGQHL